MDELTLRYREACEQDDRRPSDSVREAVHAHARMMNAARQPNGRQAEEQAEARPAANHSRWKMSLLASVALAGLTSLLVFQFDRGPSEEKELVLGRAPLQTLPPVSNLPQPTPQTAPAQDAAVTATVAPIVTATTQPKAARAAPIARAPSAATTAAAAPQAVDATPPPTLADAAPASRTQESADASTAKSTSAPFTQNPAQSTAQAPAQTSAAAPAPQAAKQELARAAAGQAQRARLNAGQAGSAPASLHDMARTGQVTALDRLLAEGAAVNAPDATGKTPLMLAVINGHVPAMQRLLSAGANPALTDREGLTALQHARRLGRDDIVRLLEERL